MRNANIANVVNGKCWFRKDFKTTGDRDTQDYSVRMCVGDWGFQKKERLYAKDVLLNIFFRVCTVNRIKNIIFFLLC